MQPTISALINTFDRRPETNVDMHFPPSPASSHRSSGRSIGDCCNESSSVCSCDARSTRLPSISALLAECPLQESTPLQSPVMRHNLAMDQQQRSHHQHEWAKRYTPKSFVMPRPSEYAQEKHSLQSPLSPPSSMYHQHRSPGLPFSPSSHAHHGSYHLPSSSNVAIIDRYVCDECQKSFSRPSSLRIHQHSHTGERPFVCTVQGCQRAFSVRSNMRRHMKVHNV